MGNNTHYYANTVVFILYVGIDVTKYKHYFAVIDSDSEIFVRHLQIANNRERFTQIQVTLEKLKSSTGQNVQVALEDTGHYLLTSFISYELIVFLLSATILS